MNESLLGLKHQLHKKVEGENWRGIAGGREGQHFYKDEDERRKLKMKGGKEMEEKKKQFGLICDV